VISFSSLSKPLIKQLHALLRRLGFTVPEKLQTKNEGTTFVLSINGDKNYERWMSIIGFNNPKHLTKVLLYEIFRIVPPGTDLIERVKLIRREIELAAIYPVKKKRINYNRVTEKKVLEKLEQGQSTIERLGKLTQLENYIVKSTLRRLSKMSLVKQVQTERDSKNIYGITSWGVNKLQRVQNILNRLREEYNLAI
jgi:DNA-binding MarR family transcriptional regulator